jgi:hypothetical protein
MGQPGNADFWDQRAVTSMAHLSENGLSLSLTYRLNSEERNKW